MLGELCNTIIGFRIHSLLLYKEYKWLSRRFWLGKIDQNILLILYHYLSTLRLTIQTRLVSSLASEHEIRAKVIILIILHLMRHLHIIDRLIDYPKKCDKANVLVVY